MVLAVVVELLAGLVGSSRWAQCGRGQCSFGSALAFGLLIAVNVYSFLHSARFDLTRERAFSLPASVINELRPLHSGMTIVILQQHKTFGQLSASPDQYDYAAEKEVVEKIKDRIEKFREVGPRFKVHVLDVEEKDFDKKVGELTKTPSRTARSDADTPDNSIFFYSDADVTLERTRSSPAQPAAAPERSRGAGIVSGVSVLHSTAQFQRILFVGQDGIEIGER